MQHLHAWPNGQGLSRRFGDLENSVFARALEHWTSQFVTQMQSQARNIDVLWYKSDSTGFLGNVHVHIKANSRRCKCHFFAPSPWQSTTLRTPFNRSTWNRKPQPLRQKQQGKSRLWWQHPSRHQCRQPQWVDVGYVHKKFFCNCSQNTKGRCQPSNLSLLRAIARCLHRNHRVKF